MSNKFAVTAYSRWYRLYSNPTKSELAIEPAVARLGVRYRAQHPAIFGKVIADFALLDERIILEIDGKSHRTTDGMAKDRERTAALEKLGWVVARCDNEDAEREPDACVARMLAEARDRRQALANLKVARSKGGRPKTEPATPTEEPHV